MIKLVKKNIFLLILGLSLVTVFNPYFGSLEVVAQSGVNKFVQKLFCDFGQSCLFNSLVDLAIQTAGYVSILSTIYGGYLILLSNFGMDKEYAKARKILTGGIIGLVVVYMARPLTMAIVGSLNQQQDQFGIQGLIIVTNNFIIQSGVAFLIGTSSALALLSIVYGGYILIFDSFTDGNAKKAREIIQRGVIGLLVVLLAGPIIDTIINASALKTGADGNFDLSGTARALANNIGILLINFLQYLVIPLSSIVTVYAIITAGYKFVVGSATDSNKAIQEGVGLIRNSLIGLIIILGSFTIVQAVIVILPTSPQGILQNSSQVANSPTTNTTLPQIPKLPGSSPSSPKIPPGSPGGSSGPGGSSSLPPSSTSTRTPTINSEMQKHVDDSSVRRPQITYGNGVTNFQFGSLSGKTFDKRNRKVSNFGNDLNFDCKKTQCIVRFYPGTHDAKASTTSAQFKRDVQNATNTVCKKSNVECTFYAIPYVGDTTQDKLIKEYNKELKSISGIKYDKSAVEVYEQAEANRVSGLANLHTKKGFFYATESVSTGARTADHPDIINCLNNIDTCTRANVGIR